MDKKFNSQDKTQVLAKFKLYRRDLSSIYILSDEAFVLLMSVPSLNNRQTLLANIYNYMYIYIYINLREEVQEKILYALKADRSRGGSREKGTAEKGH